MKPYTIGSPKYKIIRNKEEFFNIFNTHERAIQEAIDMALSYPGNTFKVIKRLDQIETEVFSIKIDMKYDLSFSQKFFERLIHVAQKRLSSISHWRF